MSYLQNTLVKHNDFKPENLNSTKLEENDRSNGQLMGYPRYNDNGIDKRIQIQLSWTQLLAYGIPLLNDITKNFFPKESSRAFLKYPFNQSNEEEKEVETMFRQIDNIFNNDEKKKELLGSKSKKYEYSPIVRDPLVNIDEDDDDDKPKKNKTPAYKPPYAKFKLDLEYETNKVKTEVYESLLDSETGKRTRTKVDVETIDNVAEIARYKSRVRCIVSPVKFWAHPSNKKDPQYGIVWRLVKIEVDKIQDAYKSTYESENFIDSDTEEELPKIEVTKNKDIIVDVESDDDEQIKDLKPPIIEVDSSDDDSDDKPIQDLKVPIVEIDSSDDDDELPPPPPKTKKVVKAKK